MGQSYFGANRDTAIEFFGNFAHESLLWCFAMLNLAPWELPKTAEQSGRPSLSTEHEAVPDNHCTDNVVVPHARSLGCVSV